MGMNAVHWENHLLSLAYEALYSHDPEERSAPLDEVALKSAYRLCDQITHHYSRTFYLASGLLPNQKRRAIRSLYAFCRVSDDLVDCIDTGGGAASSKFGGATGNLTSWRWQTAAAGRGDKNPVALAWDHTRRSYQIPARYAEQLIDGVALDLNHVHYETFDDLTRYCYGVACTVGLMSMHIIGFSGPEAIPYAIRLGVALQLTNILRDVGEDWRAGRVYLPQEELAAFGLDESILASGTVTPAWREMMRFQIDRNRRLYDEALPGVQLLDPDGRFAVGAAAELYRAILDDIAAHDYDVFNRRASTGRWGKLRRLPGIWLRSKAQLPGV